MTLVYLVRHAENDYMKKGKLAGWTPGVHLNERGRDQANAVATLFSNTTLKAVYASPLERTMETANPLAMQTNLAVIPRPGLGEIQYGTWQGASLKTLKRRRLWPVVQTTPSLARFPEGESFKEAQDRGISEIEALRTKHKNKKDSFACFSHADMIKLILAYFLGMPLDLFQRLVISPASISLVKIEKTIKVLSINDMTASNHLISE
jgi:probable phosphoglycerate mutase